MKIYNLINLNYSTAKKVNTGFSSWRFYTDYFLAEQRGQYKLMKSMYKRSDFLEDPNISKLIKARYHMYKACKHSQFFKNSMKDISMRPAYEAYFYFLASAYYDRVGKVTVAARLLSKSAMLFDRLGYFERSLTSEAHLNKKNVSNLIYLSQYSRKSKVHKVSAICLLELAKVSMLSKNYKLSLHYLSKALNILDNNFKDPQRHTYAITLAASCHLQLGDLEFVPHLLNNAIKVNGSFLKKKYLQVKTDYLFKLKGIQVNRGSLSYLLINELVDGPKTRLELKNALWPEHAKLDRNSIDDRLRSLIYRTKATFDLIEKRNFFGSQYYFVKI